MFNPDRNRGQQSESEWNEITEDLTDRFHCAFGEKGEPLLRYSVKAGYKLNFIIIGMISCTKP